MDAVLAEYAAGGVVNELTARYDIARSTIHRNAIQRGMVKARRVLSNGETIDAVRLYEAGMTISDLAVLFGMSYRRMRQLLTRAEVSIRAQGRRSKDMPRRLQTEEHLTATRHSSPRAQ